LGTNVWISEYDRFGRSPGGRPGATAYPNKASDVLFVCQRFHDPRAASSRHRVVFWGVDSGTEVVREMKLPRHFARSMSFADAPNGR